MKKTIHQFIFLGVVMLFGSGYVNPEKQSLQNDPITSTEQMSGLESVIFSQDDGIIGSWNLELQAFDDNNNGKLDDGERKKGNKNRHFYQFKSDGTCLIHTLKLKGYYELKVENGKKRLYTFIDEEGKRTPENKWYVISITKAEMILLSQDKYAFWIYKRV